MADNDELRIDEIQELCALANTWFPALGAMFFLYDMDVSCAEFQQEGGRGGLEYLGGLYSQGGYCVLSQYRRDEIVERSSFHRYEWTLTMLTMRPGGVRDCIILYCICYPY